jgi:hypothetical protein
MKSVALFVMSFCLPLSVFAKETNCVVTSHWRSFYLCCGHPTEMRKFQARSIGECADTIVEQKLFDEEKDVQHPSGRVFRLKPQKITFTFSGLDSKLSGELKRK